MKLVDIKQIPSVAKCYFAVEQPMVVYHSTEEFIANVDQSNINKAENFGEFFTVMQKYSIDLVYNPNDKYVDIRGINLWVKTVDKFVPDYADAFGDIYYLLDKNNNPIPTDGCWVKIYFITPTPARFVLFTSAGINTIGLTKWAISGAVRKDSFLQESRPKLSPDSNDYQRRLATLLRKRKPDAKFIKLAMAMLSSDSESFLDYDKSVANVYGRQVKKEDRIKLLETQAFREAFMSVIKTLFPSLAPAIRKTHSPEQLAEMLGKIWNIAESSKNVDNMLKVFDKIKEVGYEENATVIDNRPKLPMLTSNGLTTADEIALPEPKDYVKKEKDDNSDAKAEKDDFDEDAVKEELDYPSIYVNDSEEEENKDE